MTLLQIFAEARADLSNNMSQQARNNPDLPPVHCVFGDGLKRTHPEPVFVPDTPEEKRLRELLRKRDDDLIEARAIIGACVPALDPALVRPTEPSLFFRIGYFLAKTE